MKEIKLSQLGKNKDEYVALVDDDDFESINQYKWSVIKAPNTFYAMRGTMVNGKRITQYMHDLILDGKGIDHIDRNGLNNKRSNLRLCTISENGMNRRKQDNASSIYKGVSFHKRDKRWMAHIKINGKKIHLGNFDTEVEAAKAYNDKAISLFCEFANLNVIPNKEQ